MRNSRATDRPWEQDRARPAARGPGVPRPEGSPQGPGYDASFTRYDTAFRRYDAAYPRYADDFTAAHSAGRRRDDGISVEGAPRRRSRPRAFFRRFREPIIGLSMAGAAAPLMHIDREPETRPGPEMGVAPEDYQYRTSAVGGESEDWVGERWAEARMRELRDQTVQGAMMHYNIDRDLAEDIFDVAVQEDIEPELAYGLVKTESSFRHNAVSHVGARGLTQLMPRTARWLDPRVGTDQLFERDTNLELGFRYLRQLIDKYDGNTRLALLAYNRGPGTVDKILKRGGNPDNGYADKVLSG